MTEDLKKMYRTVMDDHFPVEIKISYGDQTLVYRKRTWKIPDDKGELIEKGLRKRRVRIWEVLPRRVVRVAHHRGGPCRCERDAARAHSDQDVRPVTGRAGLDVDYRTEVALECAGWACCSTKIPLLSFSEITESSTVPLDDPLKRRPALFPSPSWYTAPVKRHLEKPALP